MAPRAEGPWFSKVVINIFWWGPTRLNDESWQGRSSCPWLPLFTRVISLWACASFWSTRREVKWVHCYKWFALEKEAERRPWQIAGRVRLKQLVIKLFQHGGRLAIGQTGKFWMPRGTGLPESSKALISADLTPAGSEKDLNCCVKIMSAHEHNIIWNQIPNERCNSSLASQGKCNGINYYNDF